MSDETNTPPTPEEPHLIRGDKLADDAHLDTDTDVGHQVAHPGLIRGEDLADGAAQTNEAAERAAERAEHPGGVRGDELAD